MLNRKFLFTLIVCTAMLALPLFVQPGAIQAQLLFEPALETKNAGELLTLEIPGAAEMTVLDLRPEVVEEDPAWIQFQLPGAEGEIVTATRTRFRSGSSGTVGWSGKIGGARDGWVISSLFKGRLSAAMAVDGARFLVVPGREGRHVLVRLGDEAPSGCALGRDVEDSEMAAQAPQDRRGLEEDCGPGGPDDPMAECQPVDPRPPGDKVEIDVLALYPVEYLEDREREAAAQHFITLAVAMANDVFDRSNVPAEYEIVHMGPLVEHGNQPAIDRLGAAGMEDARAWMNAQDRLGDDEVTELERLRDNYGADMVALFIPFVPPADSATGLTSFSICGTANLRIAGDLYLGSSSFFDPFWNDVAFSVHAINCGQADFTFAHELGHNFGMWHNRDELNHQLKKKPDIAPRCDFGVGHFLPATGMRSLMDCPQASVDPDNIAQPICERISYFSDPDILFNGEPTGGACANNAELARRFVADYAEIRPDIDDTLPTLDIVQPKPGAVVARSEDFMLKATAKAAKKPRGRKKGNLSDAVAWSSNRDGDLAVTNNRAVLETLGFHALTATVSDANGSARESVGVFVSDRPTADFTVICDQLTCSFNASTSNDPDGTIASYAWSFGDGGTGSSVSASYLYGAWSSFTVTLEVTDDAGLSATTTQVVTLPEATITPQPGAWYNPQRNGNGIDLQRNDAGDLVATWYTYTPDGTPIWYQTAVGPMTGSATWEQPLSRFTWDGAQATGTEVGTLRLAFLSPTNAVLSWTLDGQGSGRESFEVIFPNEGRAGLWFPLDEPGWGLSVWEVNGTMAATAYLYDAAGQPWWAQAVAATGTNVTLNAESFDGTGLCPACSGGSVLAPPAIPAGELTISIPTAMSTSGSITTAIQIPGGDWIRKDPLALGRLSSIP